jgi:hypothetical protein|tara:strand:- start:1283 stop:1645 length:363 start_codon:yes stop_codon:yes gene_type:complete
MQYKELARDLLAFGSPVFYALVFARALIGPYPVFIKQLTIAGVLIFLGAAAFRDRVDWYVTRSGVISMFTIIFYNNQTFNIFVALAFTGILCSSYFVRKDINKIIWGITAALLIGWISVS